MKLSEQHMEKIRDAIESVEYGEVTVKVNKDADTLDIVKQERIRLQRADVDNQYVPVPGTIIIRKNGQSTRTG